MSARDLSHSDFVGLELEADRRVSFAEQQDYQAPVGEPAAWIVVLLCLSPLIVAGVVSLAALLSR